MIQEKIIISKKIMRISQKGIELLKHWEQGPKGGFAKIQYKCSSGKNTIGYGHVINKNDTIIQPIDKNQAEALLNKDVKIFENAVNLLVTSPLSQNQFDALVCFAFNVGVGAFQSSTLLKLLNKKDYDNIPKQMLRWNKITVDNEKVILEGLSNRRKAEIFLWQTK